MFVLAVACLATACSDDAQSTPDAVTRDAARTAVEDAVSRNSVVTDPRCAMYAWDADVQVSGTVTFTFSSLTVGDLMVDGEVGLLLGGSCPPLPQTARRRCKASRSP